MKSHQWQSASLISNDIKIHYTRTGGDLPPLVLLHGFSDNGLCWSRLARRLDDAYDLIMVDARGHGLSEAPGSRYSNADHAADVAGLIRALGLGRVPIAGHSMGAATTAAVAANYPELVSRVVLEDPPWWQSNLPVDAEARQAAGELWREGNLQMKSLPRQEVIAQGRQESPTWHEEEWEPWAESKFQVSMAAFETFAADEVAWQDTVRQIACPILLVTADPSLGAIVTAGVAEEASRLWQQGQVVHIPGAGHNIRREHFESFVEAVTTFLNDA